MQQNILVVLALLTAQLNALPLNINLGAYSPALVVGDGEISFGGAAAAAAAPAAAKAQPATQAQVAPPAQIVPAGTTDQTTQITSLQGMGKEIAPRVVELIKSAETEIEKRDIAGFNAALNYATGALKTSPEVQLGTGEGGSGVGITQKAGGTPSTAPAKAGRSVEQVDELPARKLKTTVTTMFVRGGPAQAAERSVEVASAPVEKRAPSSPGAIDGVNLNMAEGSVAELTFVETRAVEGDDE